MNSNSNNDLKLILHPYTFVLKEGKKIQQNLLDYNLMMLHVSCPETIKSPKNNQSFQKKKEMMSLIKKTPSLQKPKEKVREIN